MEDIVKKSIDLFEREMMKIIKDKVTYFISDKHYQNVILDSVVGGKRLRPIAVQLVANLLGNKSEIVNKYAAAMELIHCASLISDDEIDNKVMRGDREVKTIRIKYSPVESMFALETNVFITDRLIQEVMESLDNESGLEIRRLFDSVLFDAAMGEIDKWKSIKKRIIPTRNEYWDGFVKSSGGLFFKMACGGAAILSTSDKNKIEDFSRFGYIVGSILQAGDDIKDLKSDIIDGCYSLPVILYYQSLSSSDKKKLKSELSVGMNERGAEELIKRMRKTGSIEKSFDEIDGMGKEAVSILKKYSDNENRRELISMVEYLVNRIKSIIS